MKKIYYILFAFISLPLFVHAQIIETSTSTQPNTDAYAQIFTVCSQNAIEKRDTAITEARATYNTKMTEIVTKRKEKEKAAVAISNSSEKKAAIKAAVELYRKESLVAQETLTEARKVIWETFETDVQTCRDAKEGTTSIATTTPASATVGTPANTRAMKIEITEEKEDTKTLRESLKSGIDAIKSLFK